MSIRTIILSAATLAFSLSLLSCRHATKTDERTTIQTVQTQRIWEGGYCAFTSLVKYKDRYYCSFREGDAHLFDKDGKAEGKARIIVSDDGEKWEPLWLYEKEGMDLRDPKLSVTPDGRLMVLMGGSVYENKQLVNMFPQTGFSEDGKTCSDLQPVVFDSATYKGKEWIWKLAWHHGTGYGVVYGSGFSLVRTQDGIHYEKITDLDVSNRPNETAVGFLSDSTMLLMVRCEEGGRNGMWGKARPPYTDWEWKEMDIPLGGPEFIVLGDTALIVGTRSLYSTEKTMLFRGDTDCRLEEVYILPSGGDDNSYTGLLIESDKLWVTYYSRHETDKASIYLSRLPLEWFTAPMTSKYFYKTKLTL